MSSNTCSVCLDREAKYTCPACEARTCSLDCVKRHKSRTECTGKVDPTKFVTKKELAAQESLVNRDYNYLLNFERKIANGITDVKENARKILKRPNTSHNRNPKRPRQEEATPDPRINAIQTSFPNAKETSIKRENTLVIHLPQGMSRSTQNKSGFDKKTSCFTWTIEWAPLTGSERLPTFLSFRIKDLTPLKEAVPLTVLAKSFGMESLDKDKLHFFLDNCVSTSSGQSLIPLNASESLSEALKDSIVLEFPKIYVFVGDELPEAWGKLVESKAQAYGLISDSGDSGSGSDSDSDSDSSSDSSSSDGESSSDDEAPEESSSKPTVDGETLASVVAPALQ